MFLNAEKIATTNLWWLRIIRSEGLGPLSWMVKEDRPLGVTTSSPNLTR